MVNGWKKRKKLVIAMHTDKKIKRCDLSQSKSIFLPWFPSLSSMNVGAGEEC